MKTRILLFLSSLTIVFTTQAQTVINVDNTQGTDADYDNLQDAVDAAATGDIIYVHASELTYGDVFIDEELTLVGFSHSAADKKTMVEFVTLGPNASNTKVTGFNIRRNFNVDNPSVISNIVLENNSFISALGNTISFQDGGANDVVIRGNVIQNLGINNSSTVNNVLTNAIISNNIFTGSLTVRFHESTTIENNIFLNSRVFNVGSATGDQEVQDCIFIKLTGGQLYQPNTDGVFFNNCISYHEGQTVADLVGNNNLNNTDPLFVAVNSGNNNFEPLTEDYNLQPGSPGLGNGVAGDNIGIYSNNINFTFNNFGFTSGIPVVTITEITTQIAPGGTLDVTIESNSN